MTQPSLYEGIIAQKAKKFSKDFPGGLEKFAEKAIIQLLAAGRDLALVDGNIEKTQHEFEFDPAMYRSKFDRYVETVSMYCARVAEAEKPMGVLKVLSEADNLPLIRMLDLRQAIEAGLPLDKNELVKKFEELRRKNKEGIEAFTAKAERLEKVKTKVNFNKGFYRGTPFDARPNYNAGVED